MSLLGLSALGRQRPDPNCPLFLRFCQSTSAATMAMPVMSVINPGMSHSTVATAKKNHWTGWLDLFSSYCVYSTNNRIVSTFRPSSRIAFWPSSDCSNS